MNKQEVFQLSNQAIKNAEEQIIGIGKKQQTTNNMDTDLFNQVDKSVTNSINIGKEKVKILSKHPENSYELVMENEDVCASLNITNAEEFWKYTQYLVITTK